VTGAVRRSRWGLALMVLPPVLWLVLLQVVPLALILVYSFSRRTAYGGIEYTFTLANYTRFLQPIYLKVLSDSLAVALITTLIVLVVAYPFAWHLARQPAERRGRLLLLVVIPFWTNSLILTYAWKVILRADGPVNQILTALGLAPGPVQLLYTKPAAILGLVYVLLPYMILPLYLSIEKLDPSTVRAAYDLGAGPVQAFRRVIFPLTLPGVVAGALLVFIPTLELFYISDLLGGAQMVLVGNLIQREFLEARNWPFGAAASIIVTGVTLLLVWVYVRWFSPGGVEELI